MPGLGLGLGLHLGGKGGIAPFTTNLKLSNTSRFRTAYRTATSRNAIVAFMGNSTMRGVDEGASPYNSQYPNAMPMQLASQLRAVGINAGADNWYGLSGNSMADYLLRDGRLTVTGSAGMDNTVVQGGAGISLSAAGSISFTPTQPCTKADIYEYDFFNAASISWQVDGGAATNIAQVGNNSIKKTTVSLGALGIHTLTLNWVSGPNSIFAIDCYDDTSRELAIRQWGISGATAAAMVDDSGTPHAGRLHQLASFPPDLVISECGLVNSWRSSNSVASCITDMSTLVDAVIAANSDFMFLTPPFDNSSAGLTANQQQYVDAMFQVAATKDVPVIDLRKKWGSYANAVASGWMRATDDVHPALGGYIDAASIVKNVLQSIM